MLEEIVRVQRLQNSSSQNECINTRMLDLNNVHKTKQSKTKTKTEKKKQQKKYNSKPYSCFIT